VDTSSTLLVELLFDESNFEIKAKMKETFASNLTSGTKIRVVFPFNDLNIKNVVRSIDVYLSHLTYLPFSKASITIDFIMKFDDMDNQLTYKMASNTLDSMIENHIGACFSNAINQKFLDCNDEVSRFSSGSSLELFAASSVIGISLVFPQGSSSDMSTKIKSIKIPVIFFRYANNQPMMAYNGDSSCAITQGIKTYNWSKFGYKLLDDWSLTSINTNFGDVRLTDIPTKIIIFVDIINKNLMFTCTKKHSILPEKNTLTLISQGLYT
jgi:hypothetical protein